MDHESHSRQVLVSRGNRKSRAVPTESCVCKLNTNGSGNIWSLFKNHYVLFTHIFFKMKTDACFSDFDTSGSFYYYLCISPILQKLWGCGAVKENNTKRVEVVKKNINLMDKEVFTYSFFHQSLFQLLTCILLNQKQ